MSKIGYKPKWATLHDKRADQFQELYFEKGKKETAIDHIDFMKWAYGKKSYLQLSNPPLI